MNGIVKSYLDKMGISELKEVKQEIDRLLFLYKDIKFKEALQ